MITPGNLHVHELVGLRAEIVLSDNPQVIGAGGTVVYETRNMLALRRGGSTRILPKSTSTWRFYLAGRHADVPGATLLKRSHERLGGRI